MLIIEVGIRTSTFIQAGEDLLAKTPAQFTKGWRGGISHSGNLVLQKSDQDNIGYYVIDPNTGNKIGVVLDTNDNTTSSVIMYSSSGVKEGLGLTDISTLEAITKSEATSNSIGKVVHITTPQGEGLPSASTLWTLVNGTTKILNIDSDSIQHKSMGDSGVSTIPAKYIAYWGAEGKSVRGEDVNTCLLYTSPSPRDQRGSRMPSSA